MIGIVGLGDLGGRLAFQAIAVGMDIVTFDIVQPANPPSAVDPGLDIAKLSLPPLAPNPASVIEQSDIIHWCAPLSALNSLRLPKGKQLVLHSSVMNASMQAKRTLTGNVAVAHCLMNPRRTVVVANDSGDSEQIAQHISELGLSPLQMNHKAHDRVMARSQGIFALLIQHGLKSDLEQWHEQGLLTSSAEELLQAVEHRQSQWTEVTIEAILSNPALKDFTNELAGALE